MNDDFTFGVREKFEGDLHIENIRRKGITILKNVLSQQQVNELRQELERILIQQESAHSFSLEDINDSGIVRAPFLESAIFTDYVLSNTVAKKYIDFFLDGEYRLYSQVAAISKPEKQLYQRHWHREINYQHFTSSRALAIQSLFILDEFNNETGGTYFLPGSHLFEEFPSKDYVNENRVQPIMHPGDVVIMNSMVYHRSGINNSDNSRALVTNTFVRPFIASQFDYTKNLDEKQLNDFQKMIFGFRWNNNLSMQEWRELKFKNK